MLRPHGRREDSADGSHDLPLPIHALLCLLVLGLAGPGAADPDPVLPDPADAPPHAVGDVAVTATRAEREVLDTPGHVTVIGRQTIEESGAPNVAELLRREAGIYVTNNTSSRTGYNVESRGFNNGSGGGSSLLVLVDGRRINEPSTSVPDWALLHRDDVERIEVVRGPASALYGDNAVAGVVHVITRGGEGPPRATATARQGRHHTREYSLWAGGSEGPFSLALFADRFRSDGYRDRSLFRIETFKGTGTVQLGERASLVVRGGYESDERDAPGALTRAEIEADREQSTIRNDGRVRSRFVDGVLSWSPLDGVHVEVQSYFTRRSDVVVDEFSALSDFTGDFEDEALGVNTKLHADGEIAGRANRLIVGVDLLREDRKGDDVFEPGPPLAPSATGRRTRRDVLGVFLQNELQVLPELLLTAGFRHDRAAYDIRELNRNAGSKSVFEPTHTAWSPSVGLVYRLRETLSAYASYAHGFRFPNLTETSGVFSGDPEIDPQRSRSYEVGLKHRSGRVRADLALYRMDVKDEIIVDSDFLFFGFPFVQTRNVDRTRHQGIEVQGVVEVMPWLELHGGYTYDDTRIMQDEQSLDGKRVPITPRHRGNVGLLLRLPYWLEVGADYRYVGRRFGINDFGHDFRKLDDFDTWDAHVAWRPPVGERVELAFTFDVYNASDQEFIEWGGRRTFVSPGIDPLAFFPAPEIRYLGGVSVTVRR